MKNLHVLLLTLAVALFAPAAPAQPRPVFDTSVICRDYDRLVLMVRTVRVTTFSPPGTARPSWAFTTPLAPWQSFTFPASNDLDTIRNVLDVGWSITVPEFVRMIRLEAGFAVMPVAPPSRTGTPPTYLSMEWWYVSDIYSLRGLRFGTGNSPHWWDYENYAEYLPMVPAADGSLWSQGAYLYCAPAGSPSLEHWQVGAANSVELFYNSTCLRVDCRNVWR